MTPDQAARRKIRVLVNGLHAKSGGGVTYLRNILPHLIDDERLELHLLLHEDQQALYEPLDERIQRRVVNFPSRFWYLMMWEQISLPVIVRSLSVDVTFSPANYGPLLAPAPVIMLRNALAVGRDETRLVKRLYWGGLAMMTALSLMSCRRAIAVSEYARESISPMRRPRLEEKISVVHHGVNPAFSPGVKSPGVEPFLLVVADIYIQKNLHTLVEALAIIRRKSPNIRLKIAGRRNDESYFDSLIKAIARLGLEDSVDFLGQRSEEELIQLYRDCSLFVLPSTVETFGNPLVEAMASGAPVVTSRSTAMPEIVGEGAVLFDPLNASDMAEKVLQLLDDPAFAARIASLGKKRSEAFSWAKTAQETADILVAAARKG
jgi:glycosyltransferase involved in cell wall biosynthesis